MRLRRIEERPITDYHAAVAGGSAPGEEGAPERAPRRRRLRVTPFVAAVAIAAAVPAWFLVEGRLYVIASAHVVGRTYDLGPPFRGKIAETCVEEGAYVKAGTVVVRLEDREQAAVVRAAEMNVAAARATLVKAEADLARFRELLRRGIASPAEVDARQKDADVSRATLEAREAERDLAEVRLDLTRIVSPRDGYVAWYPMRAGAAVDEHDVILTLVDDGPRWIEAYVDLSDVGRIAVGQPAEVRVQGFRGKPLEGRVIQILPAVREKPPHFGEFDRPPKSYQPVKIELTDDGPLRGRPNQGLRASVKLSAY